MKKIMAIAIIAASMAACNTQDKSTTTVEGMDSTATVSGDTARFVNTNVTYIPGEGDVMYRERKVVVWKNGQWVDADGDVTLENGIVVSKNGEVRRGDDVVVLEEGVTVNRSGNFFDKTGNAIDDAWDATKKGVGKAADATKKGVTKAAQAVKKAGEKVGEKAKEIVH
ncbi:MAG TPA: DUF6799 domain-containing protein [Ferruginibacter sp.]|nr:DUF6799 domain-containing protein [Ferruginibacter sp.]